MNKRDAVKQVLEEMDSMNMHSDLDYDEGDEPSIHLTKKEVKRYLEKLWDLHGK